MKWYVFYTEWGRQLVKCFEQDEAAARRFAETAENSVVKYCWR